MLMNGLQMLAFFLFFTAFVLAILRLFINDGRLTAGAIIALIIADLLGRWH